MLWTLLYAPLILILQKNFNSQISSIVVIVIGLCGLFLLKEKQSKYTSLVYILIGISGLVHGNALYFAPLVVSIVIGFSIFELLKNATIPIYFAKKILKKELNTKEIESIKKSSFIWLGAIFANVSLHILFLIYFSPIFWASYASFGWYIPFLIAGVMQYLYTRKNL